MSPDAFARHLGKPTDRPALLVSYVYLKPFLKNRERYHYRDGVMDSGAFSAHNSGTVIDLQDYIDTCTHLMEEDPTLSEIFALDVIGDWRAGLKNTEEMWRQGITAIPCFHPLQKEPWDVLKGIAKDYPKIAVGGLVGVNQKLKRKVISEVFARVWPCKIHGFGMSSEEMVLGFPFHSVDATNWEMGPCAFGNWKTYGALSVRGSQQNLRSEVEWHLALESKARRRWRKEMAQLEADGRTIGLSYNPGPINAYRALEKPEPPTVRMAVVQHGPRVVTTFGKEES